MHPAYSVIIFTTASGAGYGLLVWLALAAALAGDAFDTRFGVVSLVLALSLITLGLVSSTFHLGRPERSWRALSQWPTSWLSREGVMAMLTFVPALSMGFIWLTVGNSYSLNFLLPLFTIPLAVATVWCTGMIYQTLRTIRAWHQPVVTPIYLVLALATGAVLLNLLLVLSGAGWATSAWLAAALLTLAAGLKRVYWRTIDKAPKTWTAKAATGLGALGKVRPLEAPHTQPNFVMREMGYTIARTHAEKLRRLCLGFGFALPVVLLLLSIPAGLGFAISLGLVATLVTTFGVLVERWLFFAEAQHVVTIYYGVDRA